MAQIVPEVLNSLTGEERNRIYGMLRLEVYPASTGYEVNGAFCTSETRWGIGSREKTAVELAGEVISAAGGLHGLNDVSSWYSSKPLMSSSVVELPLLLILRNFLKSEGQSVQQPCSNPGEYLEKLENRGAKNGFAGVMQTLEFSGKVQRFLTRKRSSLRIHYRQLTLNREGRRFESCRARY